MFDSISNDNAANRKTYVGYVYDGGERSMRERILDSLPPEWADLHREGYIHIHDLDAYGLTYNCLTFNLLRGFPFGEFEGMSDQRKIIRLFDYYKDILSKVGNEQSGGMGFQNFDNETAEILRRLGVEQNERNLSLVSDCIGELILWCNASHERMGQVSYYVTLNIGLAKDGLARFICRSVIENFGSLPAKVFKPNIVFKVKEGVNFLPGDPNRDLLEAALDCTSRKMIPTYLLCDCKMDRGTEPEKLSIMGCRTRVVSDLFGETGSLGRGNITNISVNLPRLALESAAENPGASPEELMKTFTGKWDRVAAEVEQILLDRYRKTVKARKEDFPTVGKYDLWIEDFSDRGKTLEDIFRHGTLSIGFIGLSEAMEVIWGKKFYRDDEVYSEALGFVRHMRGFTDACTKEQGLNFSLLATSGEQISGLFRDSDAELYRSPVLEKGYYTNSFHVDVDSNLPAAEKIEKEGPFHEYCNGGCITYVELGEAPLGNTEGLYELMDTAVRSGTHYLGFNYPLDVCNVCGEKGTFDVCPGCGGTDITRIRRVSGYLEVLDHFVSGKKAEVSHRRTNADLCRECTINDPDIEKQRSRIAGT